MGLLKAGHVVLGHTLRVLGVLQLGAGVAGVRNAVRVEGRTGGGAGVARRDAPCLSGTNGLIGLTLHPRYRVDIAGQSRAGGGSRPHPPDVNTRIERGGVLTMA
jgi:hypothetical protein